MKQSSNIETKNVVKQVKYSSNTIVEKKYDKVFIYVGVCILLWTFTFLISCFIFVVMLTGNMNGWFYFETSPGKLSLTAIGYIVLISLIVSIGTNIFCTIVFARNIKEFRKIEQFRDAKILRAIRVKNLDKQVYSANGMYDEFKK